MIEPDSDGYTENVCARSSTVRLFCTASAIGRISSEAIGATTTPPITTPVAGRQKILTKPRRSPDILALALVFSGSISVRAGTDPVVDLGLRHADGGDLRAGEHGGRDGPQPDRAERPRPARDTSRCGPAWRPPRPAAAGRCSRRRRRCPPPRCATPGRPGGSRPGPSSMPTRSRPSPLVLGTEPTVISAWLPSTVRPSAIVTRTPSAVRVTESARAFLTSVTPRSANASSSTAAASESSCGRIWSRLATTVTFTPSSV